MAGTDRYCTPVIRDLGTLSVLTAYDGAGLHFSQAPMGSFPGGPGPGPDGPPAPGPDGPPAPGPDGPPAPGPDGPPAPGPDGPGASTPTPTAASATVVTSTAGPVTVPGQEVLGESGSGGDGQPSGGGPGTADPGDNGVAGFWEAQDAGQIVSVEVGGDRVGGGEQLSGSGSVPLDSNGGELPFTGLEVAPVAGLGAALTAAGAALRRRLRRP